MVNITPSVICFASYTNATSLRREAWCEHTAYNFRKGELLWKKTKILIWMKF